MDKQTPLADLEAQFEENLGREIAGQVSATLRALRESHHGIAVRTVSSPLLTEGDIKEISRIVTGSFIRHASPSSVERNGKRFVLPHPYRTPHQKQVSFPERLAPLLQEFMRGCDNLTVVTAFGAYLERRFAKCDTRLSFTMIAAMRGISHSHASRELLHWRTKSYPSYRDKQLPQGWMLLFEDDGEHFTFQHAEDSPVAGKRFLPYHALRTVPEQSRQHASVIFAHLLQSYLTDGQPLSASEIAEKTDLELGEATHVMTALRDGLSAGPSAQTSLDLLVDALQDPQEQLQNEVRRHQPQIMIEGDPVNGWYLVEPGPKTLLREANRHPLPSDFLDRASPDRAS